MIWLVRLPSSLPCWRAFGACADSDRACGRGDRRTFKQAGNRARVILRLKRACLASDAATAYREFGIWARCEGCKTARALCERKPALRSEVAKLEGLLF